MRLRSWAAFAAGVVVAGVVVAQPPKTEAVKPAGGSSISDTPKSADPLGDMLSEARTAYGKMRDYSGTYTRQERLNGSLSAQQVGEMKMRVNPVGVYVRFAIPDAVSGMEVAYSGTRRNAKVRYRQAGAAGRKGVLRLEVDDAKFLADNRHPVTEWGMGPIIELIATSTAREKTLNNPVETFTSDYQFANRNVTKYEILMRRPHALRYAARMVVFIDKETKLPIRYEAYDEPKAGALVGDLLEVYSFSDLKYNTGLGENIFDF
jgi:hypothetical protein